MIKRLFFLPLLFFVLQMQAQTVANGFRFGYLSYETVLKTMPEYKTVETKMAELREQYQAETLRVEDEFNLKYEQFLEGQREFPKTILQKRQTELQELLQRNIEFKENSIRELAETEKNLLAPLKIRLIEQIGKVGRERGYAFILDTDKQGLPFINPEMGVDLNQVITDALK